MNRQRFNRTLSFILISTLFVSVLPHQVRAETSSSEIASENPTENLSITQVSHNEDSNNVFNETQKEASATIEDHPTPENFFGKRIWDSFGLHDEKKTIENTTEEQGMSEEDNIDRNLPVSNPVYTDYIFGKNTNDKKQDIKGIEGKYTTSLFTGAATYTYPVEIPTGRNSFMPSVSLFYNSQNTRNDGVVGYGWDIGESYIERSDSKGVNIMYDLNEFKVVINSNQSDIIPVSLTDQSHGEYGEKNAENFWKYYWNTDDSWTLKDKSGIVYTFGSVSSSKEYDSSNSTRIYRWYLTEMRDANDNFIRFTYTKDSERIYPEFIYYTGHGSSDGPFIIEFHYQTRTDSAKNYRSGFLVQTKYRLNEILININGYNSSNNVRKYTLEYGTGDNGIRSILSSITEIGWDENGNSLTLSPTTFQYYNNSSTAIGWKKESASIPEPLGCNGDTKIIDVNNDAYDDIVRSYKYLDGGNKQQTTSRVYINGKNKTWMNQDSLWRFPEPFTFYTIGDDSLYIYNLLDFDGDFRIDLGEGMSFQNEQTYSVYYLTDTGWSAGPGYEDITGWTDYNSNVPDYGRRQIDVNGDGFTDLVLGYHNGFGSSGSCDPPGFMGEVRIHDVIQKKFAADTSYYNPFPFAYEEDSDCSGMFSYDPGFRIVDVNGDGLSDVVYSYFRLNNLLNLNDNERYTGVYLNNGKNGWVEDLGWSVPAPIRTSFNPSLQSDQCSKNYPFGSYAEYPGTYFMDVNGDGLNDMVFNTRAHINIEFLCPKDSFDTEMSRAIYLNNGINGWTKASNINDIPEFSNDYVAYDNRYSVSEVNGDGLLDVMYSSGNCEHGYPVDTSSLYLSQANPDTDLLKTIANPVGGTINISYASSANEKDSLGNYLNPNMQNAMRVVKKVTYNDALGTLQSTDYEYKDGKFYLYTNGLKEFGGFGKVTTKDGSTISATSFYQGNDAPYTIGSILNYSLKGKPYRTEVFDDFGRKYSESSQKWSVSDLGNGRYFPKLDAVVNFTYEGGASHRDTAVSYEYENARGNVIKETHYGEVSADPSTGNFTDLGSDGFLTTMMYTTSSDFMSFPIEFTTKDFEDNTKAQVRYYYDGSLTHGYANKGNVTKEDHWFNKDGSRIVTDFSYNFYGQVETVTNPRRYITTIEWDSNALYPIAMINAKNQRTSMTYNYGNGQIKTLTDANGSKEEYAYDPLGRLKTAKVSDPDNKNTLKTKTIYEYNDTNFPTSIAVKQYDGLTNSEPATYQYFDGFKRLIQSRTLLETSYSVKDVKYDEKGLLKEESVPYFDSGNSYKTPTWTTAKTAYVYDAFSRPLTVSFVKTNGTTYATTSYDYSTPWQTIITDPEGKIKRLRTDANQRLIEVDEVFNGITSTTRYKYHTLGFLTQITDALGNVRNFDYDSLGRTLSMQDMHAASDGDFGTWFFSYDSNGNVLTQTDANGILTNFTYDELDRPTYETDGSFSTIYGYDTSENGVGRLSYSIGSDTISTEYDYDTHGNVKKEYRIIEDKNFTTNYSSDIQGKPRSITNPDGFRTDYTYNGAGLLEQLTTSGSTGNKTIISNIDYAPTGQITSMVHGNGATTTNTFDPDDMYRLKSKYVNQGVLKLFAFDYGYDKASNITSLTDSSDTDTKKAVTYHYDDLHRLIFANGVYATGRGNYSHDFGYDILGNITYKTDVGTNGGNYRYDGTGNANPHAVTSVGGKSFTYDKNGNLLTDGDRTLTYNSKNLISRAVYNGATTDFRYDQGGNRVLKKTSDDTVWYPNQYYEIRKSGNIEKTYSYIFAGNQKVAANEGSTNFDADNDGWTESGGDCNDNDATVHPGASEICGDSVDQDCSGADLSCNDVDNDEDGYTENGGDCNDNDATVHPGASEVCGDSVDQDCSGADLSCSDADQDGDSYSVNEGDCNDNDSSVHPGATEIPYNGKDDDCLARQTPDDDLDQDDYPLAEDCDDTTDDIYPGALEICGDSIDQDCSGADEICAPDRDEDGIPDSTDNCPDTRSSNQTDSDGDGKGNICDNDTRLKYTFTPDADQ
ncbi:hypothetical protein HYV57_01645 [Candidatus Peregrinibacteria bacterium]|nr:hypothetical protein [Candidatus Peregrinibacteria bacterium]